MRFVQVQLCVKANPVIADCGAQAAKTTNRTMPSVLEMLLRESAHGHGATVKRIIIDGVRPWAWP